jgi:hypothetical protein
VQTVADDFTESVNRSADGMIRIYGAEAAAQARKTITRMEGLRDGVGERMWRAILKAIDMKQQSKES